jgi:acyl-CoA thioesterase FadM
LRNYEIKNGCDEVLAVAETDWAFINYSRQLPTRIPKTVASCFVVIDT